MKGAERAIAFAWRIAVIIALVSQLLTAAIETPWGVRNVSALMVRAGIFQARQISALQELVHPAGVDAVRSLAKAINQTVPAVPNARPIVFVWVGQPSNFIEAHLAYSIYPRRLVRSGKAETIAVNVCRVTWQSGVEVTLACPGSVRRFAAVDGAPR